GGGALEYRQPRLHRQRPIHVEARLPFGMAHEEIWIAHRVAHRQHRLAAGMNGESGVAGRVAVSGDRLDAGGDLGARLEAADLACDVAEDAPRVEEIAV